MNRGAGQFGGLHGHFQERALLSNRFDEIDADLGAQNRQRDSRKPRARPDVEDARGGPGLHDAQRARGSE